MSDWKGAEQLVGVLRPAESLIPLPDNPRQGDVGMIAESLDRFGQLKPIVVDADGVILAGNHTYRAAVALGWSQVAAVTADDLEGVEKTAFALADNRLSDLASYDNEMLLEQLSTVGDLTGIGYDGDDLEDLHALVNDPLTFEQFLEADANLSEVPTPQIECPNCAHRFSWSNRVKKKD